MIFIRQNYVIKKSRTLLYRFAQKMYMHIMRTRGCLLLRGWQLTVNFPSGSQITKSPTNRGTLLPTNFDKPACFAVFADITSDRSDTVKPRCLQLVQYNGNPTNKGCLASSETDLTISVMSPGDVKKDISWTKWNWSQYLCLCVSFYRCLFMIKYTSVLLLNLFCRNRQILFVIFSSNHFLG